MNGRKTMNYKEVYSAANATEAHLIQGLLERKSIETNLSGESLSTIWGGMQTDFSEFASSGPLASIWTQLG